MVAQFIKLTKYFNRLVSSEEFDDEDLADILWLATKINVETASETSSVKPPKDEETSDHNQGGNQRDSKPSDTSDRSEEQDGSKEKELNITTDGSQSSEDARSNSGERGSKGLPFKTPAAPPLRRTLEVSRALRPLMRKVRSLTKRILDEEGTAIHLAEAKFFMPILQPATERWLDLSFVVENCGSTIIWKETITAFQKLLERLGAFRNVRAWILRTEGDGSLQLFSQQSGSLVAQQSRSLKELSDPTKRSLIMLVSDCTSLAWQEGKIYEKLNKLFQGDLVVIFQLLPAKLWNSTALGKSYQVQLRSEKRGDPINRLIESGFPDWEERSKKILKLPVTSIEPEMLAIWVKAIAETKSTKTAGFLVDLDRLSSTVQVSETSVSLEQSKPLMPIELAQRFWVTASHQAKELAKLLAAVPISMPVVHLIQETMLPESIQTHTAEVFLSGIIKRSDLEDPINPLKVIKENASSHRSSSESAQKGRASEVRHFDFVDDQIREFLIDRASISKVDEVLENISQYIAKKAGKSIHSFTALLVPGIESDEDSLLEIRAFARIAKKTLLHIGGEYAALVRELEAMPLPPPTFPGFPKLQTFRFETGTFDEILPASTEIRPEEIVFEIATITSQREKSTADLSIPLNAFRFVDQAVYNLRKERLGDLQRMIFISSCEGSTYKNISIDLGYSQGYITKNAIRLWNLLSEVTGEAVTKTSLQKTVRTWAKDGMPTWVVSRKQGQAMKFSEVLGAGISLEMIQIPAGKFLMGSLHGEAESYPNERPPHEVTVPGFYMGCYPITQAQWKIVAKMPQVDRELKTDPSGFKGDSLPVEQVSWYDAVEFCKRLTIRTNREYRLPSEAEWEYACRAGTTTPFHFGETISPELANYDGHYIYKNGFKGDYRGKTTPVDHFKIANAFGLCDMHGNVWEWCADHWHDNYEGAPADGSAWLESGDKESYILRGGSWIDGPRNCRSASRGRNAPDDSSDDIGFRVCCSSPRSS
jgi:formylglycine-generating enzyme required for sulfatase activity